MSQKKSNRAKKNCPRRMHALRGFGFKLPGGSEFRGAVDVRDVAIGAGLGLGGSLGLKYLVNATGLSASIPAIINKFWPAFSGIVTGILVYGLEKNSSKAKGHLIGSALAGITISVWDALKAQFPQLADLVSLQLSGYGGYGGYNGMLVRDAALPPGYGGYGGMLVQDSASNLRQLQGINMAGSYEDSEAAQL